MKQYALEWSHSTNNFHIQPVSDLCALNQRSFIDDKPVRDYVILMVGTLEVVSNMAEHWRERIKERDRVRNLSRPRMMI